MRPGYLTARGGGRTHQQARLSQETASWRDGPWRHRAGARGFGAAPCGLSLARWRVDGGCIRRHGSWSVGRRPLNSDLLDDGDCSRCHLGIGRTEIPSTEPETYTEQPAPLMHASALDEHFQQLTMV